MDLLSDTIKHQLHTAAYVPSQTGDALKADIDNEVANGTGYTTGGNTLASKTYTVSTLTSTFDAADSAWTALTKIFRYGVLLNDTPASPADPLIAYQDTGGSQDVTALDVAFVWNGSGIFTFAVAAA